MKVRSFSDIGSALTALALIILVPIVAVLLLSELAPLFFDALANLTTALVGASTGSDVADAILGIFAIIVPIVGIAFFGTAAIDAMRGGRGSGGGPGV